MLKTIPTLAICLFTYFIATAQVDTTLKKSPVKTLTDAQYNALLKGVDIYNMPPVAGLNHYPMPDSAAKYKKEINLSPIQATKIEALAEELKRKRIEMGGIIVTNEKKLDDLFKRGADEGGIIFYGNRSGLYYGELRDAILMACYNTWKLLAPAQIKKLETLQNHN